MAPFENLAQFKVKVWPDGCIVFDLNTGDTHVLDAVSAAVFLKAIGQCADSVISGNAGILNLPPMSSAEFDMATCHSNEQLVRLRLLPSVL